jgi:hypothetical protein
MSKQILEQIKKLPREERLQFYNKLSDIMNHDRVQASMGLDTTDSYWDDAIDKAYGEKKDTGVPDIERTTLTVTPEKEKTGEVITGPVTEEDVRTGEADKVKKEGND